MYQTLFSTCWEGLHPLLLEFILFGFGKRSLFSQSLTVPLTGSSCSTDRFDLIHESGLGCPDHFKVLDLLTSGLCFFSATFSVWVNPLFPAGRSVLCTPHNILWSFKQGIGFV